MEYPTTEEVTKSERVLPQSLTSLRQKLGQKARQEPKFRFYTLYGHISRDDVLAAAWRLVRANRGAAGGDGVTIDRVESQEGGVLTFLEDIRKDLHEKTYEPHPVRDWVIQTATLLILEPIFEEDLEIVRLCQKLEKQSDVYRTLGRQLLRSGTSFGANTEEAQAGQSRADFTSKYSIALKEARETLFTLAPRAQGFRCLALIKPQAKLPEWIINAFARSRYDPERQNRRVGFEGRLWVGLRPENRWWL